MFSNLVNWIKALEGRPRVWRQGDVYIIENKPLVREGSVREIPPVLARGEVTGHAHRIADSSSARLFKAGKGEDEMHLHVSAEMATVVHEEHGPITLPKGDYIVRIQREYTPERIVRVVD